VVCVSPKKYRPSHAHTQNAPTRKVHPKTKRRLPAKTVLCYLKHLSIEQIQWWLGCGVDDPIPLGFSSILPSKIVQQMPPPYKFNIPHGDLGEEQLVELQKEVNRVLGRSAHNKSSQGLQAWKGR